MNLFAGWGTRRRQAEPAAARAKTPPRLPRRSRATLRRRLSAVIAALVAGLAWLAAPPPATAGEVELLSATLTVGAPTSTSATRGYNGTAPYGALTDTTISHDGTEYTIEKLIVDSLGNLTLVATATLPDIGAEFTLTLDDRTFSGEDQGGGPDTEWRWFSTGLSWTTGDTIDVTMTQTTLAAAPADLTATPSSGQVELTWSDPGDDTIDKWQYRVRETAGDADTWNPDWTDIPNSDADTTGYTVQNLTGGTAYTFEVHAVNEAGDGASASASATTLASGASAISIRADEVGHALEGEAVTFTVSLSEADLTAPLLVPFTVTDVTTTSADYGIVSAASCGNITPPADANYICMTAGQRTGTITINLTDDGPEDPETFTVSLGTPISEGSSDTVVAFLAQATGRIAGGPITVAFPRDTESFFESRGAELALTMTPASGLDGSLLNGRSLSFALALTCVGLDVRCIELGNQEGNGAYMGKLNSTYTTAVESPGFDWSSGAGLTAVFVALPIVDDIYGREDTLEIIAKVPTEITGLEDYEIVAGKATTRVLIQDNDVTEVKLGTELSTVDSDGRFVVKEGETVRFHTLANRPMVKIIEPSILVSGQESMVGSETIPAPVAGEDYPLGLERRGGEQNTLTLPAVAFEDIQEPGDNPLQVSRPFAFRSDEFELEVLKDLIADGGETIHLELDVPSPASGTGPVRRVDPHEYVLVIEDTSPAPSLSVTAGQRELGLKWTFAEATAAGATIDSWQVRNSTDGGMNWEDWAAVTAAHAAGVYTYAWTGLEAGTDYSVQVRAVFAKGSSHPSPAAQGTPTATNNPPTFSAATITLFVLEGTAAGENAGPPVVAEDPESGDVLTYSLVGTGDGADDALFSIDSSSGQIVVGEGTTIAYTEQRQAYTVTVAVTDGKNAQGEDDTTTDATVTVVMQQPPLPDAPADLQAKASSRQVLLSWADPGDDTIEKWQYRVSADGGTNWAPNWTDIPNSDADTTRYTVTGLTNDTDYTFEVRAVNAAGESEASRIAATPAMVPAAPTGLTYRFATDASTGQFSGVLLIWDVPNDTTITGYEVSTDGGTNWTDLTTMADPEDSTKITATVTGLAMDSTYTIAVRAVSNVGEGESASVTAALTRPAAPQNLTARSDNMAVALSWDVPAGGVDGYQYRVRETAGAADAWNPDWTDIAGSDADTTGKHTVTGLTNNIDYTFQVRARNVFGDGDAAEVTEAPGKTEQIKRLNEAILSKHGLTIAATTVQAVTGRLSAGLRGASARELQLAGQSSLGAAFKRVAEGWSAGTLNVAQLLGNTAFALPLSATPGGTGLNSLVLWGQGDYRNLSGDAGSFINWDGEIFTGQVGADVRLREDILAGALVSWSEGTFDYTDRSGHPVSGEYESQLTSVHPYLGWAATEGIDLWATGGYGWGEIEVNDSRGDVQASDTTLLMGAGGVSGRLLADERMIPGGTTTFKLKGELMGVQVDVDAADKIVAQTVDAHRIRVLLEGSHARALANGAQLTPVVEVGLRHDGGDGAEGTGLEMAGGLRYTDPTAGLTVEARGRGLVAYETEYEEWGASLLIQIDPGADRQGLAFRLQPSYGQTASGVQRLWEQGVNQVSGPGAPGAAADGQLEARVGYGLLTPWAGGGLLTPYSALTLGAGGHRLQVGGQWELGSAAGDERGAGGVWHPVAGPVAVLSEEDTLTPRFRGDRPDPLPLPGRGNVSEFPLP